METQATGDGFAEGDLGTELGDDGFDGEFFAGNGVEDDVERDGGRGVSEDAVEEIGNGGVGGVVEDGGSAGGATEAGEEGAVPVTEAGSFKGVAVDSQGQLAALGDLGPLVLEFGVGGGEDGHEKRLGKGVTCSGCKFDGGATNAADNCVDFRRGVKIPLKIFL